MDRCTMVQCAGHRKGTENPCMLECVPTARSVHVAAHNFSRGPHFALAAACGPRMTCAPFRSLQNGLCANPRIREWPLYLLFAPAMGTSLPPCFYKQVGAQDPNAVRQARSLYVGNVPASSTEVSVVGCCVAVARLLRGCCGAKCCCVGDTFVELTTACSEAMEAYLQQHLCCCAAEGRD